jgi:peptidyl-prolyl cis-trans isomerase C
MNVPFGITNRLGSSTTVALYVLLAVCGCGTVSAPTSSATALRSSAVLARGDGFVITDAFFTARWTEQCVNGKPAPSNPAACRPENRRDFLNNMIRFKLLAVEARRRGVQDDPDVAYAIDRVLVQKLVRMEVPSTGSRADSEKVFDALVDGLRSRAGVEVDDAKLDALPLAVSGGAPRQGASDESP